MAKIASEDHGVTWAAGGYDAGVARKVEADLRDHIASLSLSPDFHPNIRVAAGDPARRIAELAAGQQIDLVVTATSGRSGLARFVLGSVAQQILDSVPADVLIVPGAPSVGVPSR